MNATYWESIRAEIFETTDNVVAACGSLALDDGRDALVLKRLMDQAFENVAHLERALTFKEVLALRNTVTEEVDLEEEGEDDEEYDAYADTNSPDNDDA